MILGAYDAFWTQISAGGHTPRRRQRHLRSQMKFFAAEKFKKQAEGELWKFANKKRDGMGWT